MIKAIKNLGGSFAAVNEVRGIYFLFNCPFAIFFDEKRKILVKALMF